MNHGNFLLASGDVNAIDVGNQERRWFYPVDGNYKETRVRQDIDLNDWIKNKLVKLESKE